jgi:hypothetical protein
MDTIKWKKEVRKYGPRRVLTEQYNLEVGSVKENTAGYRQSLELKT